MNHLRKLIALALAALLVLTLASCGGQPTPAETAEPSPEPTAAATASPEPTAEPTAMPTAEPTAEPTQELTGPFSPNGSVIFEKDGLRVTTAGLDMDPTSESSDPIIWVDIENTGDKDAYLGVTDGSVNGFMATVVLNEYYDEETDGYFGSSSDFNVTVPAGESVRRALGYYKVSAPGVNMDTLGEIEFAFTTAEDEFSWHNYISDPVVIKTGETAEDVDIVSLGAVVIDDEEMTLVFGEQDYDDWSGPEFAVYVENKTDQWLGLSPEEAEGDGVVCDYMYGAAAVAPGKKYAGSISFDGEMRELKGIENLSVTYRRYLADSFDDLIDGDTGLLDPIHMTYPPQVWGEYENAGCIFHVKPKINELITVEAPENDPDGILFTVSETASLEAGGYDGAGWLFSIGKVSEDRLHELLQSDMSGAYVFAKDESGDYYMIYHPTDVRYERATAEEMESGMEQWTMLNAWAEEATVGFIDENEGLESYDRGNTAVDIYLARAAWQEDANATLSTTEYGPLELKGVDGTPYAEFVMGCHFWETDAGETPDGEYVALNFPDDGVRLDFFFAPGGYVRYVSGDYEALYQAAWVDDNVTCAEAMQGWYYAVAELAGVKPLDRSLEPYCGSWHDSIAGRGVIDITQSVAPGKVNIAVRWPESAAVVDTWTMTARLEDGRLVYENAQWEKNEYDEDGEEYYLDGSWEESGYFMLSDAGELIWHDDNAEHGGDSTFIK